MWKRTKFANINSVPKQLLHMSSEVWEIFKAFIKGNKEEMKAETMDLIQSAYTLLHILGMTNEEHDKKKIEMETKNSNRGYYK